MPNNQNQPQQVQVNLGDLQKVTCINCDDEIFEQGFELRKFSKFDVKNKSGQDQIIRVPLLRCATCGEVYNLPPNTGMVNI